MNENKLNIKSPKGFKLSPVSAGKDAVNNNEEFVIPFEAACSPEFQEGCFVMEDEADKEFEKK